MRFDRLLALVLASALAHACKTPVGVAPETALKADEAPASGPHTYEATRILDLAPAKQCRAFAAETGITVTRREAGKAAEGAGGVGGSNGHCAVLLTGIDRHVEPRRKSRM